MSQFDAYYDRDGSEEISDGEMDAILDAQADEKKFPVKNIRLHSGTIVPIVDVTEETPKEWAKRLS